MQRYAVGLDMGTSSIGWAVVLLDENNEPLDLDAWGSRIFPSGRDEKTNDPLAAARREARGIRRRGDRIAMRRRILLNKMAVHGLMPADSDACKKLELLNPIALRAKGVKEKLTLHELGRALFHLQQRRGFKSNRKEQDENEAGAIAAGGNTLKGMLETQHITLGQFLYDRQMDGKATRFTKRLNGTKVEYDYYPLRSMVEDEFLSLWNAQQQFHGSALTEVARTEIHRAIFHQRPLKPQPRGRCLFNQNEERMPAAMPSAQHFRILKEIHNIRIKGMAYPSSGLAITAEQKINLYDALLTKGSMNEGSVKKLLNVPSEASINLFVKGVREKLLGDETAAEMRKDDRFGKGWDDLPLQEQDAIVLLLTDTIKVKRAGDKSERLLHDEEIVAQLVENHGCTQEQAERVLKARIPTKLLKYGSTIITDLLPLMKDGLSEYEALVTLGKNHSQQYTGEVMDVLPYYAAVDSLQPHVVPMPNASDPMVKRYGRVSNPTVHVALNQLRKLMNQLVERYGCHPQRITLEMVRELKKGSKEIAEIIKNIKTNEKERETFKAMIEAHASTATDHYIAKMKLWSELAESGQPQHRTCVYTGEAIGIAQVLSEQTEIEHILPNSRTLDDTAANKTLTFVEVNRAKGEKTPAEFFATPQTLRGKTITYEDVWERANSLKGSKKWRFSKEAIDTFESKMKKVMLSGALGGEVATDLDPVAARHLVDTSYMAKFAKKYLAYICHNGEREVIATPGSLTGLLRKSWGLNELIGEVDKKNRSDHRHHAIDAFVIAMTTRSMVGRIADASKRSQTKGIKLVKEIPQPWNGFNFADLKRKCDAIIVSHKPDHGSPAMGFGTTGQLHKDTAYGLTSLPAAKKGCGVFVTRWTADSFKKAEHLDDIRDARLRDTLKQYIAEQSGCSIDTVAAKNVASLVAKYMQEHGMKGIRCLEERPIDVMIPINKKGTHEPYKYFVGGSNHRAEIYMASSGKTAGKWQVEIISSFNANQQGFVPKWREDHPNAKLIMQLHIDDMVALDEDEGRTSIYRMQVIPQSGQMTLCKHHLVNHKLAGIKEVTKYVGGLQSANARKVSVRIDGVLFDPKAEATT